MSRRSALSSTVSCRVSTSSTGPASPSLGRRHASGRGSRATIRPHLSMPMSRAALAAAKPRSRKPGWWSPSARPAGLRRKSDAGRKRVHRYPVDRRTGGEGLLGAGGKQRGNENGGDHPAAGRASTARVHITSEDSLVHPIRGVLYAARLMSPSHSAHPLLMRATESAPAPSAGVMGRDTRSFRPHHRHRESAE